MIVKKAYKIRLYPNKTQEKELLKILAGCRFVWNHFLEDRKNYYLEHKKTKPYSVMSRELTQLRRTTSELTGIQLLPLAQELRKLDKAYNSFFTKQSRFPKFKNEYRSKQSFSKPKDWRLRADRVQIQEDLLIRYHGTIPPENVKKLGTITISFVAHSQWYASIGVDEEIVPPKKNGKPIGIDVGLNSIAITNDGTRYPIKKHGLDEKIARLQRRISKQEIGSNRRSKTKMQLARLHNKISNIRRDSLHKTTDLILKKNPSLVAVESLSTLNMLKNHRLARHIANASWGEFLRQIHYKTEWRGGKTVAIDRFYPSSKTCNKCYFVLEVLPLSVREWDCPKCKEHHDRDVNAANVILKQAQSLHLTE